MFGDRLFHHASVERPQAVPDRSQALRIEVGTALVARAWDTHSKLPRHCTAAESYTPYNQSLQENRPGTTTKVRLSCVLAARARWDPLGSRPMRTPPERRNRGSDRKWSGASGFSTVRAAGTGCETASFTRREFECPGRHDAAQASRPPVPGPAWRRAPQVRVTSPEPQALRELKLTPPLSPSDESGSGPSHRAGRIASAFAKSGRAPSVGPPRRSLVQSSARDRPSGPLKTARKVGTITRK